MKLTRLTATAGMLAAIGVSAVAVAGPAVAYPANQVATASINSNVFTRGAVATVTVENATPGGVLTMIFESNPVVLSSGAVVGPNSTTGTISGTIPATAALGSHTITVNSTKGETFSFGVTVVASGNGGGGGSTVGNSGSSGGGNLASTGAAVTGVGILGGVLVAGGVFFVVAGRRRTANQTPSV